MKLIDTNTTDRVSICNNLYICIISFVMRNIDLKKIIEWLGLILKCPICGHKYTIERTKVIETEQDIAFGEARILIHSDCTRCKSSVMFNVEIRGPEVFSVGMVTDLTSGDSNKFKDKQPITTNEVLSIHQALSNFKGDFVGAFKK